MGRISKWLYSTRMTLVLSEVLGEYEDEDGEFVIEYSLPIAIAKPRRTDDITTDVSGQWVTFYYESLNLIPGKKYAMIVEKMGLKMWVKYLYQEIKKLFKKTKTTQEKL